MKCSLRNSRHFFLTLSCCLRLITFNWSEAIKPRISNWHIYPFVIFCTYSIIISIIYFIGVNMLILLSNNTLVGVWELSLFDDQLGNFWEKGFGRKALREFKKLKTLKGLFLLPFIQNFLFAYLSVCYLLYTFNHFDYLLYWCKYINPSVKLHIGLIRVRVNFVWWSARKCLRKKVLVEIKNT